MDLLNFRLGAWVDDVRLPLYAFLDRFSEVRQVPRHLQANLLSATPRRHNALLCEMLRDNGAGVIRASRVIEPRRDDGRDVTWHPSALDRDERWTAMMADAGTIALVSLVSPLVAHRAQLRKTHDQADLLFVEVFVDTAVEECGRRDPKGLYARARAGEIRGFTGVDAPYEPPEQPELRVDTSTTGVEQAVAQIIEILRPRSGSKRRGAR